MSLKTSPWIIQYCLEKFSCPSFYDMIFTCIVSAFSLTDWMATRGLTGSLSKAVSDELLDTLGIGLFKKERSCDRAEAPYSTNKLTTEGWSSGKTLVKYVYS